MTELYWISKTIVIDWPLTALDGTTPVTDATVTATISLPDGTTTSGVVTQVGNVVRATYDPTLAGWHAYRLKATGTADSADEGKFYVKPSLAGSLPVTLDPATAVGATRLLAADVDEDHPMFTDAQYSGFLSLNGGVYRLAAAQALEACAASEALVSKKIRTQDLSTDGPAVAAELRALAASLRAQHDDGIGNDGTVTGAFVIVDFNPWAALEAAELAELAGN